MSQILKKTLRRSVHLSLSVSNVSRSGQATGDNNNNNNADEARKAKPEFFGAKFFEFHGAVCFELTAGQFANLETFLFAQAFP